MPGKQNPKESYLHLRQTELQHNPQLMDLVRTEKLRFLTHPSQTWLDQADNNEK